MEQQLFFDDMGGTEMVGVGEILDQSDLTNGFFRDPVPADATFYKIIEWVKKEVPAIERHSFFTGYDPQWVGFTNVVFSGRAFDGRVINAFIEAHGLRLQSGGDAKLFHSSGTVRARLQAAFEGQMGQVKLYPGDAIFEPTKPNPIGRMRVDWGSGPMYEFAEGAKESDYPETDPMSNTPTYAFEIEGEALRFARTKRVVRGKGGGPQGAGSQVTIVPAWRLQGR